MSGHVDLVTDAISHEPIGQHPRYPARAAAVILSLHFPPCFGARSLRRGLGRPRGRRRVHATGLKLPPAFRNHSRDRRAGQHKTLSHPDRRYRAVPKTDIHRLATQAQLPGKLFHRAVGGRLRASLYFLVAFRSVSDIIRTGHTQY